MSLLKNIFGKKDEPVKSYADFWKWFQQNERTFYKVVKQKGNIEKDFFNRLAPQLTNLKDGYFFLVGMYDDQTVELVITPDGVINNIVFAEELVAAAPHITGWKFTALKPPVDINNMVIEMAGYKFKGEEMYFYAHDDPKYPDEININVVHDLLEESNKKTITQGTFIFLDNFLGEMNFVTVIDNINIIGRGTAQKELIPIEKLKDYLAWREKEFIEKYEGTWHDTENDSYAGFEAQLESGNALIAVINMDLLKWDGKASHPWILTVAMKYSGNSRRGMPDEKTSTLLETVENEISDKLKDADGYLNIGRQTADNVREVYFACKDFRLPSKVMHDIVSGYKGRIEMSYDIYKDKYWRSFERFAGVTG